MPPVQGRQRSTSCMCDVDCTLTDVNVTCGAPNKAILLVETGDGLLLAAAVGCRDPGGAPALQLAVDGPLRRQLIDDGRDDLRGRPSRASHLQRLAQHGDLEWYCAPPERPSQLHGRRGVQESYQAACELIELPILCLRGYLANSYGCEASCQPSIEHFL